MFCRSLFVLLYVFFWPLCCLFFFDIRILIAPLVYSNSSYHQNFFLIFILYHPKEDSCLKKTHRRRLGLDVNSLAKIASQY